MSGSAFLTIEGQKFGCLTEGCNTQDSMGNSFQLSHKDEITVLSFSHGLEHNGNQSVHHPIQIVKKMDKSSPVLAQACADGDTLKCSITFYRPSPRNGLEKFYTVELTDAKVRGVSTHMPHTINFNEDEMHETLLLSYRDIQWKHHIATTSGYSSWLNHS
ncbi:Hcp family type VI secretion system effector [Vibrio sp. WXL103]|uniref:Hcp family type VI secretion system effector n=1 Tax=Vibrio sp. WXL103 TaxID=3450710 RepID=UPI003EC75E81